jgi:hypothetical protein
MHERKTCKQCQKYFFILFYAPNRKFNVSLYVQKLFQIPLRSFFEINKTTQNNILRKIVATWSRSTKLWRVPVQSDCNILSSTNARKFSSFVTTYHTWHFLNSYQLNYNLCKSNVDTFMLLPKILQCSSNDPTFRILKLGVWLKVMIGMLNLSFILINTGHMSVSIATFLIPIHSYISVSLFLLLSAPFQRSTLGWKWG